MLQIIVTIIFIVGLTGMAVILCRKIPVLTELEIVNTTTQGAGLFTRARKKINPLRKVPSEDFLKKSLWKVKILSLKTENKTSGWLEKLQKNSKERSNNLQDENYWKKLRRFKEKK